MVIWFQAVSDVHKFTGEILKWIRDHVLSDNYKDSLHSDIGVYVVTNESDQRYKEMDEESESSRNINLEPHFDKDEKL